MDSRKRTLQSPVVATCKRGLACLSLICTLQMLPQTVLANDTAAQVNPTDFATQIELTDSAVQAESADAAVQADPADVAVQADPDDVAAQNNTADSSEATLGLEEAGRDDADVNSAASDDAESHESEGKKDNALEAGANDASAAASDDSVTRDDKITDDADTEKTKAPTLVLQLAEDTMTAAGEFPSRFDLRDLGLVTPVKLQDPWGTCWAFAATSASESSIHPSLPKWARPTRRQVSTFPSGILPGMSHNL